MQAKIDIEFNQLVKLAKRLSAAQWIKLKREVEKEQDQEKPLSNLESFLLTAPTFNMEQLDDIAETRKAISEWRTKLS